MKRLAALCVAAFALVSVPSVADAQGVLVDVTPHKQVSDGRGTIDISVSVVAGATSTCTLFDDSGELEEWRPCLEAPRPGRPTSTTVTTVWRHVRAGRGTRLGGFLFTVERHRP